MLLARTGARVTVLERLHRIGGRSASLEANGFRFDAGPTFFLYPRVLEDIFASCGRRLADEIELIRLDPMYRLIFEDAGELPVRADPRALMAEVARLCPADAARIPQLMADNRRKLEAFQPVLEMPFNSVWTMFSKDVLKALPQLRPWRTLDRDLAAHFSDPRVRLAFSFQSKYLGMSPFKCPSMFTILSFLEHEFGVFHPRGGCGAVMAAMARIAKSLGVEIRTGEPVVDIEFEGRRPVAVRTPGSASLAMLCW